jgi:flavin-dependent dehydrogenase
VLVVDRSTFPSDTISTHVVHPQGIAALKRWGLLDRLTGCPPIDTYVFDFGPFAITGTPGTPDAPIAYCPRRIVLDKLLVDAAVEAGAEVREGFIVDEVIVDNGRVTGIRGRTKAGTAVTEMARIVIGADGRHSLVARAVQPDEYNQKPELLCGYYAYWSGVPMRGRFETYIRPNRGFAAAETHDGLTMIVGGWPRREFEANKGDLERHYHALFDLAPEFAERLRGAKRESKVFGAVTPNAYRKPFGPGWALVGDAGYIKDPITAQGITDAFRDAELVVDAIATDDFAKYQATRDAATMPMYELTCQLAALEPPPPDLQQLLGAVHGNQDAMDMFCRMNAGITSPAEFFAESNVQRIFGAASMRACAG